MRKVKNKHKYPITLTVVEEDEDSEWCGETNWKCKVISIFQFNNLKNITIKIETSDPEKWMVK
jgi:hypothetical protein